VLASRGAPRGSLYAAGALSFPHVIVACRVPLQKADPTPPDQGRRRPGVGDAAAYVLTLDQAEQCNRWRRAAQLLLEQPDVAAVSRQVHLALFYDAALDIGAMDA
jgi:hypothetical protein